MRRRLALPGGKSSNEVSCSPSGARNPDSRVSHHAILLARNPEKKKIHGENQPKSQNENRKKDRRAPVSRAQQPSQRRAPVPSFHFTTAAAFVWPPSRVIPSSASASSLPHLAKPLPPAAARSPDSRRKPVAVTARPRQRPAVLRAADEIATRRAMKAPPPAVSGEPLRFNSGVRCYHGPPWLGFSHFVFSPHRFLVWACSVVVAGVLELLLGRLVERGQEALRMQRALVRLERAARANGRGRQHHAVLLLQPRRSHRGWVETARAAAME
jgi:hypothetical protein